MTMKSFIVSFVAPQASNQTDLENWITAVHSMAASVVVGPGQKGKHEMLQILSTELNRVEAKISSDSKLKKMAELQSTVVTDSKNKQAFLDQVISFFIFLTLCWLAYVENSSSLFPTACLVG